VVVSATSSHSDFFFIRQLTVSHELKWKSRPAFLTEKSWALVGCLTTCNSEKLENICQLNVLEGDAGNVAQRSNDLHEHGVQPLQGIFKCSPILREIPLKVISKFLISKFRHVLNVVCFLLGDSPVSEFYMPTFWNTLPVPFHEEECMQNS